MSTAETAGDITTKSGRSHEVVPLTMNVGGSPLAIIVIITAGRPALCELPWPLRYLSFRRRHWRVRGFPRSPKLAADVGQRDRLGSS